MAAKKSKRPENQGKQPRPPVKRRRLVMEVPEEVHEKLEALGAKMSSGSASETFRRLIFGITDLAAFMEEHPGQLRIHCKTGEDVAVVWIF